MVQFPHLFSEGQLGRLRLPNRCLVSSLTRASATEKGLVVPPEVLADGRELSRWLDANK